MHELFDSFFVIVKYSCLNEYYSRYILILNKSSFPQDWFIPQLDFKILILHLRGKSLFIFYKKQLDQTSIKKKYCLHNINLV